jgi:hypothetical protein
MSIDALWALSGAPLLPRLLSLQMTVRQGYAHVNVAISPEAKSCKSEKYMYQSNFQGVRVFDPDCNGHIKQTKS